MRIDWKRQPLNDTAGWGHTELGLEVLDYMMTFVEPELSRLMHAHSIAEVDW
jgi:hypothetical protein